MRAAVAGCWLMLVLVQGAAGEVGRVGRRNSRFLIPAFGYGMHGATLGEVRKERRVGEGESKVGMRQRIRQEERRRQREGVSVQKQTSTTELPPAEVTTLTTQTIHKQLELVPEPNRENDKDMNFEKIIQAVLAIIEQKKIETDVSEHSSDEQEIVDHLDESQKEIAVQDRIMHIEDYQVDDIESRNIKPMLDKSSANERQIQRKLKRLEKNKKIAPIENLQDGQMESRKVKTNLKKSSADWKVKTNLKKSSAEERQRQRKLKRLEKRGKSKGLHNTKRKNHKKGTKFVGKKGYKKTYYQNEVEGSRNRMEGIRIEDEEGGEKLEDRAGGRKQLRQEQRRQRKGLPQGKTGRRKETQIHRDTGRHRDAWGNRDAYTCGSGNCKVSGAQQAYRDGPRVHDRRAERQRTRRAGKGRTNNKVERAGGKEGEGLINICVSVEEPRGVNFPAGSGQYQEECDWSGATGLSGGGRRAFTDNWYPGI